MTDNFITQLTAVTAPDNADLLATVQDVATTPVTKKVTWTTVKAFLKTYFDTLYGTSGETGYTLSVTVSANDLIVALKTASGGDPSSSDPVNVKINGVLRSVTGALSVTAADATNWCNAGSAELATIEVDYFVYLGYDATDGVVIGFSRIPYAEKYSDFSATSTNEKYCKISTITNASADDPYRNIGRFAATLSAGAGYTWTVPTFTPLNLINRPIFETRMLTWAPTIVGFSSVPTNVVYRYTVKGTLVHCYVWQATNGTSDATNFTMSAPFTSMTLANTNWLGFAAAVDNSVALTTPARLLVASNSASIVLGKDFAGGAWTASNGKRAGLAEIEYAIA